MIIAQESSYIVIGIFVILISTVFLAGLVHRDLAPRTDLPFSGKLLLMAGAGGAGILAFATKMIVLLLLMNTPSLLARPFTSRPTLSAATATSIVAHDVSRTHGPSAYVWSALPEKAPTPNRIEATTQQVALGEKLFSDQSLSINDKVSCASCHDVANKAGGDGLSTSIGVYAQRGRRNAPTVWNAAFQKALFWDGRARSLEEQALGPLTNPLEMAMPSLAAVEQRVASSREYQQAFRVAFPDSPGISIQKIAYAIASYERTLITPDTAYDRFVKGDIQALNSAQIRGMTLFEEVGCIRCHSGPNFSGASLLDDNASLRIFPAINSPFTRRYRLKQDVGGALPSDSNGVWRIPSLRNVALTAPYFHNGSVSSLNEAVRVMISTEIGRPLESNSHPEKVVNWLASTKTLSHIDNTPVTDHEVEDIVAFLNALSSDQLIAQSHQKSIKPHPRKVIAMRDRS